MSIYATYLFILVRLSSLVALKDGTVLSASRRLTGDTYTIIPMFKEFVTISPFWSMKEDVLRMKNCLMVA